MRVVVAIDSFKGSLTSREAGEAVREAVRRRDENACVTVCPIADGGEGTVDAMYSALGGKLIELPVTGPLGDRVTAKYLLTDDGRAVIEMASASGLTLIPEESRNPLKATTRGVGELIRDAIKRGARSFVIGIGGSATNDGGVGMLSALGFDFLDKDGAPIPDGIEGIELLCSISVDGSLPELRECSFRVASDVDNPLFGERGCSAVFGPQKGATAETVARMDAALAVYAEKVREIIPSADPDTPGAGAAGGIGYAFMAFLGAKLESGISIILDETGLDARIKDADIVVTGEGRLDSQTVMGKAPIGVAKLAKKYGKRVIAFAGCVTEDAEVCNEHGIDAFFPIVRGITTKSEALDRNNAYKNLAATAYQVFGLI